MKTIELFFEINEKFDNAARTSLIKKIFGKIKSYKKSSILLGKLPKNVPLKNFFLEKTEKTGTLFFGSKIFSFLLKAANATFALLKKQAEFPQWVLGKIARKKLFLLGTLLVLAITTNTAGMALNNRLPLKGFFLATALLLASALLILLGAAIKKHGKNSFFHKLAEKIWEENKI